MSNLSPEQFSGQQQLFNPAAEGIRHIDDMRPHELTHEQFTQRSDTVFHSSNSTSLPDYIGHNASSNRPLHAGTRGAAMDRVADRPLSSALFALNPKRGLSKQIFSDRSANEAAAEVTGYEQEPVGDPYHHGEQEEAEDAFVRNGPIRYINEGEDIGSVSVVGLPEHFQTHHQAVTQALDRGDHVPSLVRDLHRMEGRTGSQHEILPGAPRSVGTQGKIFATEKKDVHAPSPWIDSEDKTVRPHDHILSKDQFVTAPTAPTSAALARSSSTTSDGDEALHSWHGEENDQIDSRNFAWADRIRSARSEHGVL